MGVRYDSKSTLLDKNETNPVEQRKMATSIAKAHHAREAMSPKERVRQREHVNAYTHPGFCERFGLF